jgi:hypothetical protein
LGRHHGEKWREEQSMDIFVVQHVHEFEDGREDVQFIGVYSTAELAA